MNKLIQYNLCEENRFKIIKDYFQTHGLVKHQIDSFNWFVNKGLKMIINNEPSIKCDNYTLKFNNICVEKPAIIDEDRTVCKLYPQEARNKNLSYTANVCVDTIETIENAEGKPPQINEQYRVPIAKIPVMLMSDICHLRSHSAKENEQNSHSEHDQGGYFIINGKERVLISQVRKAYNKPLCFIKSTSQKEESLVCEMRSMCEETFHSTEVEVKSVKNKIVASLKLKGTKVDIPVGIIFKALGYTENMFDELLNLPPEFAKYVDTIKHNCVEEFDCGSDSEDSDEDDNLVQVFRNMSVSLDKDGVKETITIEDVKKSLDMDLFPHLGITSSKKQRAQLLCVMIKKFLFTLTGILPIDNRDDYNHKRVESAGELCYFLFRLLYKKFQKSCIAQIKNRKPDISSFLKTSAITTGMMYSFSSGYWGVQRNTYIRTGVSQVVNPKVSLLANYSSLRRVVIPESKDGKEAKTSELRQIHPSSSFLICPVETPEGKGVGTVLNMAVFTSITTGISTCEIMDLINQNKNAKCTCKERDVDECFPLLINGTPYGYSHVSQARRINFLNDRNISIVVDWTLKIVEIFSDSGRLIRPIFDLSKVNKFFESVDNTFQNYTFSFFLENQLIRYTDINEV
ncbi:DNA-directed RNA polymerase subunit B'' [Chloriridovirus anopheles1]|uniref:DNA-directed RNA polymerase n=1 Tax=Chloriridovirus anopheles1 TaxID=1465751 RepID=W8QE16_9VIRU|nr:DNA-directed RNA polymerase subunit B'' [Anopheles minimus iridovirus]AHL67520.1 DNA-directed RNA polymerase subunit B'' [Anopheles minimus iridovirus]